MAEKPMKGHVERVLCEGHNEKEPMEGSVEGEPVVVPCEQEVEVMLDEPMEGLDDKKVLDDVPSEEQVSGEEHEEDSREQAAKVKEVNGEDAMEEMAVEGDDGVGGKQANGALGGQKIQKSELGGEEDNKMREGPKEGAINDEEQRTNDQGGLANEQQVWSMNNQEEWTNGPKKAMNDLEGSKSEQEVESKRPKGGWANNSKELSERTIGGSTNGPSEMKEVAQGDGAEENIDA
eukprot:Gb_00239 [translate_table: standard]